MIVSKKLFAEVGGFDPQLTTHLYRDVDFCQRVRASGKKILWTPLVTVVYLGDKASVDGKGISEGDLERQVALLQDRWIDAFASDQSYNRNLSCLRGDFSLETELVRGWDPLIDSKPRVVSFGTGSLGSYHYRVKQPLDAAAREGLVQHTQFPFVGKRRLALPTVVDIERLQPSTLLLHNTMHDDFIEATERYKKRNNAFIVFGQDDLMSALPPKNPFSRTVYRDMKKRVRRCLALADRVVVSTQPLAEALHGMSDDIRVVPNYLDARPWQGLSSRRGAGSRPRVGWAGAQQHLGDLELLREVVQETASMVDWVFFGMCPDFLLPYVKEVHPAVTFEHYPQALAALNLDLAVAPLEHNRFNEAKSNLRLLEYGVLGWPVIASDIEPYRGAPVCRVPNQPRAWVNAIRERLANPEAAWREGDALKKWVQDNWILQDHLSEWLDALQPCKESKAASGVRNTGTGV